MIPLPLGSPRWKSLQAHFGNAGADTEEIAAVPTLLARWKQSLGSYGEEQLYDPLHESYLHQGTIVDVAYAVVPHLVEQLDALHADRRLDVLGDLASVESIRRRPREEVEGDIAKLESSDWSDEEIKRHLIQAVRDRNPILPDDLAPAYFEALARAQAAAAALLGQLDDEGDVRRLLETICELHGQRRLARILRNLKDPEALGPLTQQLLPGKRSPSNWRRHVEFLRQLGWTDADLVFGFELLTYEDEERYPLVHAEPARALEALREAGGAPAGWLERTGLNGEHASLACAALRSMAWLDNAVGLATMLAR